MRVSAIWLASSGLILCFIAPAAAMPRHGAELHDTRLTGAVGPDAALGISRPAIGPTSSPPNPPDNYNFTGKGFDFSLTKRPHPKDKPEAKPEGKPEGKPETNPQPDQKPRDEQNKGLLERGWNGTLDLFGLGA